MTTAIQDFSKAIELNPEDTEAYKTRGIIHAATSDFDTAIQEYNIAIDLDPEHTEAYIDRGVAWLHLSEWEKAKADLNITKEMGIDIVASFHNYYESVEAFEAKYDVKVPEDLAALLR